MRGASAVVIAAALLLVACEPSPEEEYASALCDIADGFAEELQQLDGLTRQQLLERASYQRALASRISQLDPPLRYSAIHAAMRAISLVIAAQDTRHARDGFFVPTATELHGMQAFNIAYADLDNADAERLFTCPTRSVSPQRARDPDPR